MLGVGELLPLAPARRGDAAGAAGRHRAHDRGRAQPRAARLRPRARAVRAEHVVGRAAPLARAERRHVPRAGRAGALDPGRAQVRRAVLRPPRRAHRLVRGHARADGARVPGDLPGAAPGRRRVGRARAPPAAARCRSPSSTTRSAGAAAVPARAAPAARRRSTGSATVLTPRGARADARCAAGLRDRVDVVAGADTTEARCSPRADVVVAASVGQAPAPGLLVRALRRGRGPGRRAAARLRGGARATASSGCSSSPATSTTLAAQLERLIATTALRERLARRGRRRRARAVAGRASPTSFEAIYGEVAARRHAAAGRRRGARAARRAPADRRRPAHAHRPLARLRDAGRGAARHRPRRGPRRDRGDRPQRDLRRARRARQGRASTASR